ncbi:hypothetical protein BDV19DRAFT_356484 [Aspergillus venezuelensis]
MFFRRPALSESGYWTPPVWLRRVPATVPRFAKDSWSRYDNAARQTMFATEPVQHHRRVAFHSYNWTCHVSPRNKVKPQSRALHRGWTPCILEETVSHPAGTR